MSIEAPKTEEEFDKLIAQEHKSTRRDKFDLSSTRVVLEQLLRDGLIKPDDKLSDVMAVVEDQYKRIEDI